MTIPDDNLPEPLSPDLADQLHRFTRQVMRESAEITRKYFRQLSIVDRKDDGSPVTIADQQVEELIRACINREFPGHGIIGEEFDEQTGSEPYTWVIDPIDGTKSFIAGAFDFGTQFALLRNGQPVFGAVYQPILDDLYMGDNQSAEWNGQPIEVKSVGDLSNAILLGTDLLNVGQFQDGPAFQRLTDRVQYCRTWGNCFGYTLLASGLADIMLDPVMSAWDTLPVIPIVRGAGGVVTDWQGGDPVTGTSLVASSAPIHARIIEMLNGEI